MLIEELFRRRIMKMGSSPEDPSRQIGVFNLELVSGFGALRQTEMEKIKWLVGDWWTENRVPATSENPAYVDTGAGSFRMGENDTWLCRIGRDGRNQPHITYDPFSSQWMYVLTEGAYGILRSPGWTPDGQIVFTGPMMMIGVACELRQSWRPISADEFFFLNEERLADGTWAYVDEWHFRRKR